MVQGLALLPVMPKVDGSSPGERGHFVNFFSATSVESGLEWREMNAGKKLGMVFYKGMWKILIKKKKKKKKKQG